MCGEIEPGICGQRDAFRKGYVVSEAPENAVRVTIEGIREPLHIVPVESYEGKLDLEQSKVYKHLKSGEWVEIAGGWERGRGLQKYVKSKSSEVNVA